MANLPSIDLSWLGGGVGGLLRGDQGGYVGGGKANAFRNFTEGAAKATDERFASEAKKARSLRTYLAEIDPTLKDRVQAMGLGDLEGRAMSLAEKKLEQKQKLNEDFMRQQIESMKSVADERTRSANANTAMARYAMQPAAMERWSAALEFGPTQAGADMLNAPLRAPTQQEGLSAYLRAMAGGAAPDARSLAQFAPGATERQPRNFKFTPIPGTDATLVSDEAGNYASVVQGVREGKAESTTAKPAMNPFDRMDYQSLQIELRDLNKQFNAETDLDRKHAIAGRINAAKKNLAKLRAPGEAPSLLPQLANPVAHPAAPTLRFGLVNGELMPLR